LKINEKKFINNKLNNAENNIKKTMEILNEKYDSKNNSFSGIMQNLSKAKEIMKERGMIKTYKNKIDKLFDTEGFKIIKCKKNGDCFYHALSKALNISINELRSIVSSNIKQEHFDFWKEIWDSTLSEEYDFMENVFDLNSLKNIVLTSDFWGEEVSINILQNHFKIGLIIIDSITNDIITKFKISDCDRFILLNFKGMHYDLIKYDNRIIFDKLTIPNCVLEKLY